VGDGDHKATNQLIPDKKAIFLRATGRWDTKEEGSEPSLEERGRAEPNGITTPAFGMLLLLFST